MQEAPMRVGSGQIYDATAPKSRINMTLNEDLVRVARSYTDNLSDYVEKLLASAIVAEQKRRESDNEHWRRVCTSWNEFREKHGAIADEYNGDYMPEDSAP
jgi:antitoxin CcdA